MVKAKIHTMILGWLMLMLMLGACSQGEGTEIIDENEMESNVEHNAEHENGDDESSETFSFQHIHGLAYELKEPYNLFLATHHGVFKIDADNSWTWLGSEAERHDLMGFNFLDANTMISSGHPSEGSKLKNPIGVIISTDEAKSWKPIALHGKVDFHIFEVNASESGMLYGIDASGFYRSEDSGNNWEVIQAKGLPENTQDVFSIVSDPSNPRAIMAGTKYGLFKSINSGETWELVTEQETFISAKGAFGKDGKIVAYVQGKNINGLMTSNDFGETWDSLNLELTDDAVAHIAIHSEKEEEYTVGTFKSDIYRTTDGGESWETLAKGGESIGNE